MNFLFKTNLLARRQSTLLALEEWRMICPKCELRRKEVKGGEEVEEWRVRGSGD